jgi:type I restriction enzyme S subunit
MAGEWIETQLQEIAAESDRAFAMGPFGSNIKAENYRASGVPVIRGTNIGECGDARFTPHNFVFLTEDKANELASSVTIPNDIVFVAQGTVGKVGIIPADTPYERFILSQNLMKVTVNPEVADPLFVFYFFRSSFGQHEIMSRVNPTGVPCISKPLTSLRQFGVRLPSDVHEQRAIAHILGTLDDKIELNRRMNESLEAMARTLFKSWFVDFDPVCAKAEVRDTGLPKPLADLFPNSFEESELGEIPTGWRSGRVSDLAGFLGGYAFKSKDWITQGVPVIKIGSVKPGIVDLKAVSYVSEEIAQEAKRYRLSCGDLLIGMTGYVGEVGMVPLTDNPPLLNQRVGKFILEEAGTPALAYLYCLTRRSDFKAAVETKSHGTAQANISSEGILSISIVLPPKVLRDEFNRRGQAILDRILSNHAESRILATLRDTLLPKLISGDLRIEDAERFIGGHS